MKPSAISIMLVRVCAGILTLHILHLLVFFYYLQTYRKDAQDKFDSSRAQKLLKKSELKTNSPKKFPN